MNILFICTHNRCRSILGEAITKHLSNNRMGVFSAGSQPAGAVHPATIAELTKRNISTQGLKSQSFEDMADTPIDLAITVCDSAAGDPCPLWISDTPTAHWSLPDPTKVEGDESQIAEAFEAVIAKLKRRITHLLELNLETIEISEFHKEVVALAELD